MGYNGVNNAISGSPVGGVSNVATRDLNGNTGFNNVFADATGHAAIGTITLTASSTGVHTFSSGSGSATVVLPDATTLQTGWQYLLNNNATGTITVQSNGGGGLLTIPAGGAAILYLESNGFSAGQWDYHSLIPSNGSWGTAGLTVTGALNSGSSGTQFEVSSAGAITAGSWQASTIATTYGGTGLTSAGSAINASNFAAWNASGFLLANSFVASQTSTATAGGTTVLGAGSNYWQIFTGSQNQTVTLPAANNVVDGRSFCFYNLSTGIITIQTPASQTVLTMSPSTFSILECTTNTTGAGAAAWSTFYAPQSINQAVSTTSTPTFTSVITTPANSQSSSLSLGSAYQNAFGYDVMLTVYVAVVSATSASILCGVGSTSTPTQQTVISGLTLAALNVIPVNVYLPSGYYALISTSGTISASISGQQATPV